MSYDRMKANAMEGEHCRFCGEASAPLLNTPCCDPWICCDTHFVSIEGGGYCQVAHDRFTLDYSHYIDGHKGLWQAGEACRNFCRDSEYVDHSTHPKNTPRF